MKADSTLVARVSPSPNFGDRRGRAIEALVLHYTGMSTGEAALARLLAPGSEVSCHYLVWEDGTIEQLVAERDRAWHAGRSAWAGETDMNAVSVGIEIVNAGHDGGSPPYPDAQIDAVVALVADVCARHEIAPARVLGHSDIAPARKEDPGEYFPWHRLAAHGLATKAPDAPDVDGPSLGPGASGAEVEQLQAALGALGYDLAVSGRYDDATTAVVRAFQRRFRPERVDGVLDASTHAAIAHLAPPYATLTKPG